MILALHFLVSARTAGWVPVYLSKCGQWRERAIGGVCLDVEEECNLGVGGKRIAV